MKVWHASCVGPATHVTELTTQPIIHPYCPKCGYGVRLTEVDVPDPVATEGDNSEQTGDATGA